MVSFSIKSLFSLPLAILFLFVSLIFVGCDPIKPNPYENLDIIGIWEQDSYRAENCNAPLENELSYCKNNCEILQIGAGTITIDEYETYEFSINKDTMIIVMPDKKVSLKYTYDGDVLTFFYQQDIFSGGCSITTTYHKAATDIDGNIYHTVDIGTQTWMVENLKTTRFNDGTDIPFVSDGKQWENMTSAAACWYDNNHLYKELYGVLYNFYAAKSGNICPQGWHVPSDAEWTKLSNFLGGETIAGGKLKETGTNLWWSPNSEATNESGFTALPGGTRYNFGQFDNIGRVGYWWTSTPEWYRQLLWQEGVLHRYGNLWQNGMCIRCVKN